MIVFEGALSFDTLLFRLKRKQTPRSLQSADEYELTVQLGSALIKNVSL